MADKEFQEEDLTGDWELQYFLQRHIVSHIRKSKLMYLKSVAYTKAWKKYYSTKDF
jgi:hypothetical protein